uniref:RxLR effector candidate protein n=1 Tax=Hyaloperonospora arabidopsidis (strain Emoy2) TaxID=559515 RepID=M4B191_HYAAE
MRAIVLLHLLVAAHVCYCGLAGADQEEVVKDQQTRLNEAGVDKGSTGQRHVRIDPSNDKEDEERVLFFSKLGELFKSKKLTTTSVEKVRKNSDVVPPLQKATSDGIWQRLRAHFSKLKANASPIEKAFFVVLFILFVASGVILSGTAFS